jgi:hypothetical protein
MYEEKWKERERMEAGGTWKGDVEDNSQKDENICKRPSTERNEDTEDMEVERTGGDRNNTEMISLLHKPSRRISTG